VGIAIEERRGFIGHHLFEDRHDRLALGEPLPADLDEQPRRLGFVEADRPGGPPIGKCEPVELVENPGEGRGREPDDGEDSQMRVAEPRLKPAHEGFVGQERIEMHGNLRHTHAMTSGRDR
jgi:hypothetical protein